MRLESAAIGAGKSRKSPTKCALAELVHSLPPNAKGSILALLAL